MIILHEDPRVIRKLRRQFLHEIWAWRHIWERCTDPKDKCYPNYGGRGISVCQEWTRFENFLRDVGPRPSADHSIDRIDSDGNYEPENCQWATKIQQNNNRRGVHIIELNGWLMTIGEAMRLTKSTVHPKVVRGRIIRSGWKVEDALTTPVAR